MNSAIRPMRCLIPYGKYSDAEVHIIILAAHIVYITKFCKLLHQNTRSWKNAIEILQIQNLRLNLLKKDLENL